MIYKMKNAVKTIAVGTIGKWNKCIAWKSLCHVQSIKNIQIH